MKNKNKILLICGNLLKHQFFALKILKNFENSRVVFENYPKQISKNYTQDNSILIKKHFNNVIKSDEKLFGKTIVNNAKLLKERTLISISKGNLNSSVCLKKIQNYKPDLIILCATSIINGDLFKLYSGKIINFHAGLCQYYRGAGCNVWAIYNKEIDKIGATIHFIDENIDTGNIIIQGRPFISINDTSHTIGSKVVKIGIKLTSKVILFLEKYNYIPSSPQKFNKKTIICSKKNFNYEIVKKLNLYTSNGMIKDYSIKSKNINIIDNLNNV